MFIPIWAKFGHPERPVDTLQFFMLPSVNPQRHAKTRNPWTGLVYLKKSCTSIMARLKTLGKCSTAKDGGALGAIRDAITPYGSVASRTSPTGTSDRVYLGGGFKYFLYFHPYLGKWSNLTNIFQMGWFNHQPDTVYFIVMAPLSLVSNKTMSINSILDLWSFQGTITYPYTDGRKERHPTQKCLLR